MIHKSHSSSLDSDNIFLRIQSYALSSNLLSKHKLCFSLVSVLAKTDDP